VKSVVLSEDSWKKLRQHLIQTQPKSVMLSRSKMREVLGFTDRRHTDWNPDIENDWSGLGRQTIKIYLDFFDESKKTFFLLKYSDWIN
jgi:hypothetical protein